MIECILGMNAPHSYSVLCCLQTLMQNMEHIHTYMWSVRSPAYNGAEELQVVFCVNGCALSRASQLALLSTMCRQFELGYKTTVATMSVAWLYSS